MRRDITGTVEVPYDRKPDGTPITMTMLVLSCGHRVQPATARGSKVHVEGQSRVRLNQGDTRWCKKCEREGRT